MTDKIPVRAVYSGTDSVGLSEFQTGETIPVANGGTGATTAADARTNLGVPLGTSGAVVPLLSTANSWSATQDFKNTVDAASLGSELTTNGTFTGNATGWTLGTGWAYGSNSIVCTLSGSVEGTVTQNISVTSGTDYLVTWDQTNSSANSATIQPSIGAVSGIAVCPPSTSLQSQAQVITAGASGSLALTFTVADLTSTGTITIDNVSVKAITLIPANITLRNNSGTVTNELRSFGANSIASIGVNALKANISGLNNVAIGAFVLQRNTVGTQNGGLGVSALANNTSGSYNTGIGVSSLYYNSVGSYNVAVGNSAGSTLTTGSNNTCLGYNAQPSSATVSNEITLGDANVTAVRIPGNAKISVYAEPLAWNSNIRALQLGSASAYFSYAATETHLVQNAYFDTSNAWKYINTSASSNYYQSGGNHVFRTAASGTAGNAITWNTALTIDSTGLTLGNTTSNIVKFANNGVGAPTFNTRSAGTKLVLYDGVNASNVDAGMGIDTGNVLWTSIFTTSGSFKWYGGTTEAATLTGTGDLTVAGTVSGSSATGFRNKIINGDFQVWQRGTTFTDPTTNATAYCADRWQSIRGGFAAGITISQQSVQTNSKSIRVQRNSGNSSTVVLVLQQCFETIEVKKLAGKTVTLQAKILRGANYSASSNNLAMNLYYGTGTDSTLVVGGFTGQATAGAISCTLTTSNTKFTLTATLPSNATQLGISFEFTPTGAAGAADYFEITDVQLEEGSVATPFERKAYGLELSLCQRYYWKWVSGTAYANLAVGECGTNYQSNVIIFPVTMRRAPDCGAGSLAVTVDSTLYSFTPVFDYPCLNSVRAYSTQTSTAGKATRLLANNSTTAYFTADAEL